MKKTLLILFATAVFVTTLRTTAFGQTGKAVAVSVKFDLMGHSDPQTTRRYTHATDRAKRAAVEAVRLRVCHNPATNEERRPLPIAVSA